MSEKKNPLVQSELVEKAIQQALLNIAKEEFKDGEKSDKG